MRNLNIVLDMNGMDGNQHTACFEDFINLQESPCGFGDTEKEAILNLIEQVDAI